MYMYEVAFHLLIDGHLAEDYFVIWLIINLELIKVK